MPVVYESTGSSVLTCSANMCARAKIFISEKMNLMSSHKP